MQQKWPDSNKNNHLGSDRFYQRTLPTAGLIPAAFQAIIAKESCIAWLPKISDATTINHLKLGDRSKSNTLAY